ncbi:MAG: hypothetical protein ACKN9V_08210 [Pseudomonadota bacterium]
MSESVRFFLMVSSIACLFLCYGSGFGAPIFYIDDGTLITIPQLALPFSLRLFRVLFTPGYHLDFYPLREWSYWLDIHFFPLLFNFGTNQRDLSIFRIHNFCLFMSSALGLFSILRFLNTTKSLSLALVILWILNPYHYETVAWISARKDVLAMNYFIWSAVAWLKFEKTTKRQWGLLSLVLFICSLLSKTSFILCPFALLVYLISKRRFHFPFLLAGFACCISIAWGLIQSWHYTAALNMHFFYPWSYRIQASLAALGRMVLGVVYPEVNAIDTHNLGEWLDLNKKFLWWGLSFLSAMLGASLLALKNTKLLLFTAFFWATYLPISGLLFTHRHFYSVRYFEPSLIVLTVGLAFSLNRWEALIRYPIRAAFFGAFFLYFATALFFEKNHWSSNLEIVKKAMRVTPGNVALTTYYLTRLKDLSTQGGTSEEIGKLIKAVESSLNRQCLPEIEKAERGASTLCEVFFASGYWPQREGEAVLAAKAILDWAAKKTALSLNTSLAEARKEQWAIRLLLLNELAPPPTKIPFLLNEESRQDFLAALHKWNPESDEYLKLQKEWEKLGVLSPGFDVLKYLQMWEKLEGLNPHVHFSKSK